MKKHLAVFQGSAAQDILLGKKLIETRFSKHKIPPFGSISTGDLVYIKPSGEEPIGQFRVQKVIFYDNLDSNDLDDLRKRHGKEITADEKYWESKKDAKYGTVIFIGATAKFITSPIKFTKKDLRGWVILN